MLSQADSVGKIGGAAEHSFWQRARTFGSETLDYIESDVADLWHHPLDAAANVIRGVDSLAALQTQLEFDPVGFMQTSSDIRTSMFASAAETWRDFSQGSIDQRIDMLARGAVSGLEFGGTMIAGDALAAAGKALSSAEILSEGGLLSRVGVFRGEVQRLPIRMYGTGPTSGVIAVFPEVKSFKALENYFPKKRGDRVRI